MRLDIAVLAAAGAVVFAHPAAARPRDEAMSNAFRCASISDTRTWLDCYYGAAQPARAALRMPPAPAGQTGLVANPPHGVPPARDAALRDQVMTQAFACKTMPDERQWLRCYYAAAEPARTYLGLPPAVPPRLARTGAAAATPFGMRAPAGSEIPDSADRLSARMASYSFDGHGIFTVTLDDGQVWKQVSGDTSFAHWNRPAANYTVRLSHGFLGSYNLAVAGNPGVFKVRRVQ
ncbi:MAG TPA: hypothetical protein VHC40_01275 [Rhizomicrobium sp.]|nr:hypothetical protein [Rhizomicrobium sp.]